MTFSIGDVLEQLSDDFPDITVSKIRFLESQGLLAPMRTASGFRMFSDSDVSKLKWILLHQRDRFLPLKVIKEFLATLSSDAFDEGNMPNFDFENSGTLPLENEEPSIIDLREPVRERPRLASVENTENPSEPLATVSTLQPKKEQNASEKPQPSHKAMLVQEAPASARSTRRTKPVIVPKTYDSVLTHLDVERLVGSTESMPPRKARTAKKTGNKDAVLSLESMTIETGISGPELKELVKYGVLVGTGAGNATVFHRDEIPMALTVAPLLERGIEVRHIKNYVLFASREIGFLEHIVQDDLRRKNPEAVEIAQEKAKQFIQDTARLKEMLLLKALKNETQE